MKPYSASYPMIYREAAEVHWDFRRSLSSIHRSRGNGATLIGSSTYSRRRIRKARRLVLTENTVWRNFPDSLRSEIENWMEKRRP